ncbi:DUF1993 family protein [Chitinimonas arctica]|nr:DUF1993 domain-containing protein [Chitinimonas arctica]
MPLHPCHILAMTPHLYTASIPVFQRYLRQLHALIDIAEALPADLGILHARIAPDMLPFTVQMEIAANFALRACYPLANRAVPPYGDFEPGFDGLRARFNHVANLLAELPPSDFFGAEQRQIEDQAGQAKLNLPGEMFLFQYALPNFFFHATAAYTLLRRAGAAIGKGDFDGFHVYAAAA